METIAESLKREGREEGVFDVARNILAYHFDITVITTMTGLSVEQISTSQPAFA